jgi:hypothetical protein
MDCEHVAELTPWLINGTLQGDEGHRAREHLAQCRRCRQELGDTAAAWSVYQQHVPTEALVDHAFGRPATAPLDLIERHLESCEECAEQLELVQESRRLEQPEAADSLASSRWRSSPYWPYAALAAGVVCVIAIGGWIRSSQRAATLAQEQQAAQERLANLEAQNRQLRETQTHLGQAGQEIARLQEQIKRLNQPQLNPLVQDLSPVESTQRAGGPNLNRLEIPPKTTAVTLILRSDNSATYRDYSIEIVDARRAVVWSASGLVRQPTDDYTITVPVEALPAGRFTIRVYGQSNSRRVKSDTYLVETVRRKT